MITIDWSVFTPWASLGGGLMIGLAAALFILFHGRIMGVSSIVGGLLRASKRDRGWRVSFLSGLILAPLIAKLSGFAPTIKIDQSFVRDILTDKEDLALSEAIIGLSKAFDREVLAEGV